MSGFGNNSNNKIFFNVFKGKFAIRTSEENAQADPHGVSRVNKNGKTVHELHFGDFTGLLCKIGSANSEDYGQQIVYQFIADNDLYELKLSVKSRQARAINFRLPNIDLSKEFTLHVFDKEEDGKSNTILWISQEGNKVLPFWTKDEPKDLPQAIKTVFDGEERWDFGDQRNYLMTYLAEKIIPKLIPVTANMQEAAVAQSSPAPDDMRESGPQNDVPPREEEVDDLPF